MKLQLILLSTLLVCAFALPVPDEHVSHIKNDVKGENKQYHVHHHDHDDDHKHVEVTKSESRSVDVQKDHSHTKVLDEKKSVISMLSPDTEIDLSHKVFEQKEKKADFSDDEKISEQNHHVQKSQQFDKQSRSEQVVASDSDKIVPIIDGHEDEHNHVVDEVKSVVPETHPEGKSSSVLSDSHVNDEHKIEILSEPRAELKHEITIIPANIEGKKYELPARQERTTEEKHKDTVVAIDVPTNVLDSFPVNVPITTLSKVPSVVPAEVKSLKVVETIVHTDEHQHAHEEQNFQGKAHDVLYQKTDENIHNTEYKEVKQDSPVDTFKSIHETKTIIENPEIMPVVLSSENDSVSNIDDHSKTEQFLKKVDERFVAAAPVHTIGHVDKFYETKTADKSKESEESTESKSEESKEKNTNQNEF